MAIDRGTMHRSHLDGFLSWLADRGWHAETPKGDYEVLRLRHPHHPKLIILYTRSGGQHLSFGWDQMVGWSLFRQWQREMRKRDAGLVADAEGKGRR